MTTELARFTQWVVEQPQRRYTALMGLLSDPRGLEESFDRQDGRKAVGVDGVSKVDYGRELDGRLAELSARLRRMGYRPKPVRRVYISKASGGRRALGLPSFEDRIVQDRLSRILQAIWEPEFRDCSFGFRPGRSAHQALGRLKSLITAERTQWLVETDIKGFFDSVDHEQLMRFVAHRVGDTNLLRIIRRFLKAGVLEDGAMQATERGTPQGGLVSPVLANIYLHYVLDVWFERRFARQCQGKAHLVRYADDFVACFEFEADARRFLTELRGRLNAFGLEVEPTKTALIRFGNLAPASCRREGLRRPLTFNFLGFTHYAAITRSGRFALGRKTHGERIRKKLKMLGLRLAALRTSGARAMLEHVCRHVAGHIQYYGVTGNTRSLRTYVYRVSRLLFKWLNRRSQRRSVTWARYATWLARWLPRPRIVHVL
ncbi:MAG: group II intron reverse transcriptase/maturase [Burkholderiales bacterium]